MSMWNSYRFSSFLSPFHKHGNFSRPYSGHVPRTFSGSRVPGSIPSFDCSFGFTSSSYPCWFPSGSPASFLLSKNMETAVNECVYVCDILSWTYSHLTPGTPGIASWIRVHGSVLSLGCHVYRVSCFSPYPYFFIYLDIFFALGSTVSSYLSKNMEACLNADFLQFSGFLSPFSNMKPDVNVCRVLSRLYSRLKPSVPWLYG